MRIGFHFLWWEMGYGVHPFFSCLACITERRQMSTLSQAPERNAIFFCDPVSPPIELLTAKSSTVADTFCFGGFESGWCVGWIERRIIQRLQSLIQWYCSLRNATAFCFLPFSSILVTEPVDTVLPEEESRIMILFPLSKFFPETLWNDPLGKWYRRHDAISIHTDKTPFRVCISGNIVNGSSAMTGDETCPRKLMRTRRFPCFLVPSDATCERSIDCRKRPFERLLCRIATLLQYQACMICVLHPSEWIATIILEHNCLSEPCVWTSSNKSSFWRPVPSRSSARPR